MCNTRPNRSGFTLTELLAVITIIAWIVAITTVSLTHVMEAQRYSQTRNSMKAIHALLKIHWNAVVDEARRETDIPESVVKLAEGNMERARVVWIKFRLVEAFPQYYGEIEHPLVYEYKDELNRTSYVFIPPSKRKYNGTYKQQLSVEKTGHRGEATAWPDTFSDTHSSACLRIALSTRRAGTSFADLGETVATADTDGDGVKEFIDGWGTAISFFRFPTANQRLHDSNPFRAGSKERDKFRDPLDPQGRILNFEIDGKRLDKPQLFSFYYAQVTNYHPLDYKGYPFYTVPVIGSAGPDRKTGLSLNMIQGRPQLPDDNIYSFELK